MKNDETSKKSPLVLGVDQLSINGVADVAFEKRSVELSKDQAFRDRIDLGPRILDRLLKNGAEIYGVNTGFGNSCTVAVPTEMLGELQVNLTRFHGCGLGEILSGPVTRSILLVRLNSLSKGYSAVRFELLEKLAALINNDILPLIPAEGSVGASGDLTPLSYVAAALIGERDVMFNGRVCPASEALREVGISPLKLAPKEGIALMNGTAVMTGIAALAWVRAEYLVRLSSRITALCSAALKGNKGHFDPRLFKAKPHAGPAEVASWIFSDLQSEKNDGTSDSRIQDRYSIRCAPHVIGVLADALPWMKRDIENEMNGANDNPLIDVDDEEVLHGGHFYGGHIAFAMDSMKTAVANVADLMDRQMALLVDSHFSNGLPDNLAYSKPGQEPVTHGLKALQIAASSWAAEALKLTMPASVFSRSTECHNQDKVSMGTISARDSVRVLELTEQVASALLIAVRQAMEIRTLQDKTYRQTLGWEAVQFLEQIEEIIPFVEADIPLDSTLHMIIQRLAERGWSLYR